MSFCTLCGAGFEFTGEHRPGCKALAPMEEPPASSGRGSPARENAAVADLADPHPALDGATTALHRRIEELTGERALLESQNAALSRRVLQLEDIKPLLDGEQLQRAESEVARLREELAAFTCNKTDRAPDPHHALDGSTTALHRRIEELESTLRLIAASVERCPVNSDALAYPAQAPSNPRGMGPVPAFVGDPEGEDPEPCGCEETDALKARLGRCRAILRALRLGEVRVEAVALALERELGQ